MMGIGHQALGNASHLLTNLPMPDAQCLMPNTQYQFKKRLP